MKAPAFEFVRPGSVDDALAALRAADDEGRLLAGGQSLVPMLNLRLVKPSVLIDTGALTELLQIHDAADRVVLGSRVTHAMIEDGCAGDHWGGLLERVAADIGYRGVRNRGTIGGSVAHADPAADWPVVLAALDAEVEVIGPTGTRTIRCEEFVIGPFTTVLEADEMITGLHVPKLSASARCSYVKVRRKAGAFADALACAVRDPERGLARVVVGGSATGLRRLYDLESRLGREAGDVKQCIAGALEGIAPEMDRYHGRLYSVATERAMMEVAV